MTSSFRVMGATLSVALSVVAWSQMAAQQSAGTRLTPAEQAKADSGRPAYTAEDVHFMQGMISHHTQAVIMAGWADSHGARPDVLILCKKIDVSQRDEILTMQTWLKNRRETVPQPDYHYPPASAAQMAGMPGMPALMPGMLTPEQMAQLFAAHGPDFDRLFLMFMIQHHEGAISMVQKLFDTPGAGQDDDIFKFASDVNSDQTAEIERMQNMLGAQ